MGKQSRVIREAVSADSVVQQVNENIAAFGGDPSLVTIWVSQSAPISYTRMLTVRSRVKVQEPSVFSTN